MTFAEFHAAAGLIAKGRAFGVRVDSTQYSGLAEGQLALHFAVYIEALSGGSWSDSYDTPEAALAEMRAKDDGTWKVVAPRQATLADFEAVGDMSTGVEF